MKNVFDEDCLVTFENEAVPLKWVMVGARATKVHWMTLGNPSILFGNDQVKAFPHALSAQITNYSIESESWVSGLVHPHHRWYLSPNRKIGDYPVINWGNCTDSGFIPSPGRMSSYEYFFRPPPLPSLPFLSPTRFSSSFCYKLDHKSACEPVSRSIPSWRVWIHRW